MDTTSNKDFLERRLAFSLETTSYRGIMTKDATDTAKVPAAEAVDSTVLRLIPEFDGTSGTAIAEWLEKVELVCSLRGVTALQNVIPLRLTGGAFAVYQQLPATAKKDAAKITEALTTAFGTDAFSAYEAFAARRLEPNETVDVYLAALKKLANSFGGIPDKALSCAFVAGLPENARHTLRAASRMEALTLEQLLSRARAIMAEEPRISCAGYAQRHVERTKTSGRAAANDPTCFECGGANHLARDCLQRRRNRRSGGERAQWSPKGRCFRCGANGHRAASCPGNEEGEKESAPASSLGHH